MLEPGNREIEVALAYHQVTKHSYTSVRRDAHFLDWSNRPLPYKIYPSAGTMPLPRDFSLSAIPTLSTLRPRSGSNASALDLESLTRLLFCAGGLTKRANVGGEDYHFRAAASAGALYPVEFYLIAGEVEGMERGLYHFLAADLKLHGLRRGDWRPYLADCAAPGNQLGQARAILIMTNIFWRSAWKYRARAYRYCFWDAGMILANLLAVANADELDTVVTTTFCDGPIEKLLEIDGDREGVACLVTLGQAHADCGQSPALASMELESIPLSAKEVVYEDLVKVHRASRLSSRDEVLEQSSREFGTQPDRSSAAIKISPRHDDDSLGLGETILRRGSTRVFSREPITAEELAAIMATSHPAATRALKQSTETYLIVNAVEGLAPGTYHYGRETGTFEPLKAGDFRAEAGYLCLEQPLGVDCSALIIYMNNLERTLRVLGNRGYRHAHLEAGLLGGRAYLAAYSLGRGATGLTFYDDDTTSFLQPHCGQMSPLLMVAVGQPRSRRGET